MKNKRSKLLIILIIAVIILAAGITYAWFIHNSAMSTLYEIMPPDEITIIPVSEKDGSELQSLELEFKEDSNDRKDVDGTIHIYRPICVKSTNPAHRLEIVHTTNLKNLNFRIFPAMKTESGYVYSSGEPLPGGYKNQDPDTLLAKEQTLDNYESTADVADVHAYPLYWIAVSCATKDHLETGWKEVTSYIDTEFDPATKTEKEFYYTYYYLEISWNEETKETDLFYIMAQNIAQ